ncbi:hypothetical protein J6590_048097 [Homalodisca vitripennis]|nr:hypothetical protein J6590_048097 [Homalodisca vitripennis]
MVSSKIPLSYIFSFLVIISAPKCIFSTSILETPYFGSIEVDGEFACSATVIDDVFVLASNSCISGHDVSSLAVRVGTDKLGHRGQVYNVHKLHYYFDNGILPSPPDVDVVLVEVSVPFWFNPRVTWLNPNNDGIKELQNGIVSTWAEPKEVESREFGFNQTFELEGVLWLNRWRYEKKLFVENLILSSALGFEVREKIAPTLNTRGPLLEGVVFVSINKIHSVPNYYKPPVKLSQSRFALVDKLQILWKILLSDFSYDLWFRQYRAWEETLHRPALLMFKSNCNAEIDCF